MERRAPFSRVILIVLDSVGCGELPDAGAYGDEGSDTLGNIATQIPLRLPNLRALGLNRVARIGEPPGGSASGGTSPAPPRETSPAHRPAGQAPGATESGAPGTDRVPDAVDVGAPRARTVVPHAITEIGAPRSGDRLAGTPHAAIRAGAFGRMAEASPGKDSVTGHWEMMGVVLARPFPTFPHGFPAEVLARFEQRIGRGTLGNVVASGTEIIDRLGEEHVRTGKPIVYTSADSVFQIAAHEDVIPVAEQYRMCEAAFDLVGRGMGVGRVIARPFVGRPGAFTRTANRHDYALEPAGETLLDRLTHRGIPTVAVGKVHDLFAGRGFTRHLPAARDGEAIARVVEAMRDTPAGLIFSNLVEFDTEYGHRNDVAGYAANLERFDERLQDVLGELRAADLLVITADHGNDPTTPSTDHSREYVPLLVAGAAVAPDRDLGTRRTFADVGQTLAENFGVGPLAQGSSFLGDLRDHHS